MKVFDISSYDFDNVEAKSGAPLLKPMGQRRMTEIYCRDGASFLKEIDKFGFCSGYWQYSYQIPAHPMWFNRDEIVYISEHPRSMSCYGYARTQAVLDIIKSLHYSTLYNKKFFEETSIPDGFLSLLDTNEQEAGDLRNWIDKEFRAQPHKLGVVNKDIKWIPLNMNNRDLEFLETQKQYYNFIISMFGLTPAEMGMTQDVNRATSATQSELVKRKGIRPLLKLLEDFINQNILPEFGYEGIEFQFIYDDPAEKASRLANYEAELRMGVKTINEVRLEMGLEPKACGDDLRGMAQIGMGPQMGTQSGMSQEEDNQSSGYEQNRNGQEGKNESSSKREESERNQNLKQPFKSNKRPVEGFKSFRKDVDQVAIGMQTESKEHPELPENMIRQLVMDHLREDPQYYSRTEKKVSFITASSGKKIPIDDEKKGKEGKKEEEGQEDQPKKDQPKSDENGNLSIDSTEKPQNQQQELPEQLIKDDEIKQIVKDILTTVPEVDQEGTSTGSCQKISESIAAHINELGIKADAVPINSKEASQGHFAVFVPDLNIVIDTQLWQYEKTERKPIDDRQIIFTKQDYKERGFEIAEELPSSSEVFDRISQTQSKEGKEEATAKSSDKSSEDREIKREIYEEIGEEIYRILVSTGMSPRKAAMYSQRFKQRMRTKGVDDGQYYREQTFKPAPKLDQPQMPKPKDYPEMYPSQLGSDYRKPERDKFENKDEIHCPMCGMPTLTVLNSMEQLPEDIRCTNCGARFNSQQIVDSKVMEEISNTLTMNNMTDPISIPRWSPKSIEPSMEKKLDLDMDLKEFVGFDAQKMAHEAKVYAESAEYRKLMREYLSDLNPSTREKIATILKNAIKSGESLKSITQKISRVINDKVRAEGIARTEVVRLANEGNLLKMEDRGTKRVKFISAPEDGRLCEKCKEKDGKIYKIDNAKGVIPLHPRCRCNWTDVAD